VTWLLWGGSEWLDLELCLSCRVGSLICAVRTPLRPADPVINSRSESYGVTDLGADGISTFFAQHRCNQYCQAHWQMPRYTGVYYAVTSGTTMEPYGGHHAYGAYAEEQHQSMRVNRSTTLALGLTMIRIRNKALQTWCGVWKGRGQSGPMSFSHSTTQQTTCAIQRQLLAGHTTIGVEWALRKCGSY